MLLNSEKNNYILFHLAQHWETQKEISDLFCFEQSEDIKVNSHKNRIIFPLSKDDTIEPIYINVLEREVPIFFPVFRDKNEPFYLDSFGNLIFTHDYLKSSFYILSGFQEINSNDRDFVGRYKYDNSIQKKYDCVTIPIVNYYFEVILQGLELFCATHGMQFKRKRFFDNFGFLLSHDVDQISFWHWRETAYKLKQIIGLAPLIYSKKITIKLFFKGLLKLINPFDKSDPWWNFDEIIKLENDLKIKSAYYFLRKEDKTKDSLYKFNNKKIKSLIKTLIEQEYEVNLHGTIKSAENINSMLKQVNIFKKEFGKQPIGIRQHFLRFFHPQTFLLQEKVGLKYDTTLAFAEHDGYRNGYCYPFKPYDFENERTINIWEIPLIMMEVSMLNYRKLNFSEIKKSVFLHIEEVKKFGGIFSMLWHNSRLSEYENMGITGFYETLLKGIIEQEPICLTGENLIENFCK